MKLNYEIYIDEIEYVYNPEGEYSEEVSEEDYEFINTSLKNYRIACNLIDKYKDERSNKEYEETRKKEEELRKNHPEKYKELQEEKSKILMERLTNPCLLFDMIPKMPPLKQGYRAKK